jgi:hypothetical protein
LAAVRSFKPPPVSRHNRRLEPFDGLVARALAKKRRERFADCQAMADALEAVSRKLGDFTPLSSSMQAWFPDAIRDERHLAHVALASADTNERLQPTNEEKGVLRGRGAQFAAATGAFVVTVVVTSLVTRAVVRSGIEAYEEKLLVAASDEALQPKLGELVVKPAVQTTVAPVASGRETARPADPPLGAIAPERPAPRQEVARPKPKKESRHDWTKDATPSTIDDDED